LQGKEDMMKWCVFSTGIIVLIMFFMSDSAWAVSQTINYQGKLTDAEGNALSGSYEMVFYLYDVESQGDYLWGEGHAVDVTEGIYNVQLGSSSPFPENIFDNNPLYLEVQIWNQNTSSHEKLEPRQLLTSTPFAMRAAKATEDDPQVGSNTLNRVPKWNGSALVTGSLYDNGNIGIGTPSPGSKLEVTATGETAGSFTSNYPSELAVVLKAEYTGTGDYDFATAVEGSCIPQDGKGYGARFNGGYTGVKGEVFVTGSGEYYGVSGEAINAIGSGTQYGVYGYAHSPNGTNYSVYGFSSGSAPTDYAGYFNGDVHIDGTLSKGNGSFKIDHPLDPENKYLQHSFVESPDMMNIYNGNVILDEYGGAWIELPAWFEALNRDFRYQLTCIGGFAQVYIAEKVSSNRFRIAGGYSGLEVSWQITGIRQDPFADANPISVEEDKPEDERGYYLHPEAYGQSEERGVGYRRSTETM
jgi:hypothetical protein